MDCHQIKEAFSSHQYQDGNVTHTVHLCEPCYSAASAKFNAAQNANNPKVQAAFLRLAEQFKPTKPKP
jgi:hypothetical protein